MRGRVAAQNAPSPKLGEDSQGADSFKTGFFVKIQQRDKWITLPLFAVRDGAEISQKCYCHKKT